MAFVDYEQISISVPGTSTPSLTFQTSGTYRGFLHAVRYVVPTSTSQRLSETGILNLVGDRTSFTLFRLTNIGTTADALYFPRLGTVLSTAGETASTGSAMPPIFDERLTVTITSGSTGNVAKTGTLGLYFV